MAQNTNTDLKQDWRNSAKWKELSAAVREFHHHQCQCCGKHAYGLHVHHKYGAATHPEKIFEFDNLIPLCDDCHTGKHGYHEWLGGSHVPSTPESLRQFIMERRNSNSDESILAFLFLVVSLWLIAEYL